jgi:SnoaL-like domain
MSEENVENVRRSIDAWNRDDLDGWLAGFAPEAELHTTGRFPDERVYRGRAGLERYWAEIHEAAEERGAVPATGRSSRPAGERQHLPPQGGPPGPAKGPRVQIRPPRLRRDLGSGALLVNGGGIDGGDGASFANHGEDVHVVVSLAPFVPGHFGCM